MKFKFCVFFSITFLMFSCQKIDVLPNSSDQDYRNKLIGIYTGTIEYTETVSSIKYITINDSLVGILDEPKHVKGKTDNQTIEITKSEIQSDVLIINGINFIPQIIDNKDLYKDMFLYSSQNCSGIETYTLAFQPQNNSLIFRHKHNQDCKTEKFEQYNIFIGKK